MRHTGATRGCEDNWPMVIRLRGVAVRANGLEPPFGKMEYRMRGLSGFVCVAVVAVALQGCGGASGGDPGARSLPAGQSCQSIRGDLNRLDARGVQSIVERQTSGGKLSAAQKADADLYNRLLGQYLGSRCHV